MGSAEFPLLAREINWMETWDFIALFLRVLSLYSLEKLIEWKLRRLGIVIDKIVVPLLAREINWMETFKPPFLSSLPICPSTR